MPFVYIFINLICRYTPVIYAEGYIVFVFPFVCSFICTSVTFVEFTTKVFVKVSQVGYISKSHELLIRKHSYFDHGYIGRSASMP